MKKLTTLISSLLIMMYSNFNFSQLASQINITGSTEIDTISVGTFNIVDDQLSIVSNGLIEGWTVTITGSFTSGDEISYNGSLPNGITASSFNTATRSMQFTGTVSASVWQEFLRRITIKTNNTVCTPEQRKVSFNAGYVIYNPLNDHFYLAYPNGLNWTGGQSYAGNQSFYGVQGYLTTVTSIAENSFIQVMVNQNSWIGCSDNYQSINEAVGYTMFANQSESEGQWYWVTGPEKGTKMRTGNAANNNLGIPISGIYQNWSGSEPNDWPDAGVGQEDYGHMYSNGSWNDFANSQVIGSIIEFGGLPNDNPTFQLVFTKTLYVSGAATGTITGGNVSVCEGINSTNLTLNGLTGSVARWEYSFDDFLTPGIAIANTTTSLSVSNISTTTYYRAIVNSTVPSCSNLTTSAVPITVASTNGGTITSLNNTICSGGNADLNLFGALGSILNWEVDDNIGFSTPTIISNTTNTLSYMLTTAGTYYFRAKVQNNSCGTPQYSSISSINVNTGTPPSGGYVSNISECSTTNSGSLSILGHTGTINKWQFSMDGGLVWTDIANTSTTQSYSNINSDRVYRVLVTSASCGSAYSSLGEITIIGQNTGEWLGTEDSLWQNANNWRCNFIPTSGMDILINASASHDMYLDQNRVAGGINFNSSGIKIYLQQNDLTVSGYNNTNQNNYFVTNNSGVLKMNISSGGTQFIPIGQSAYNPVLITNNTGNSDFFDFRVVDSVMMNGTSGILISEPHVMRTWNIGKHSSNSGSGIDFIFYWDAAEESAPLTSPTLNHHNGSNWEIPSMGGSVYNSSPRSLSYTGYTGTFSPFAIGDHPTSPLPVELGYFNLDCNEEMTELNWQTITEYNTAGFVIEFSMNNIDWEAKSEIIVAAGTSVETNNYSFTDINRIGGYYRLVQYDIDGEFQFFGPLHSDCGVAFSEINVFPNPTSDKLNISINLDRKEEVEIRIIDVNNKILLLNVQELGKGKNLINYELSQIPTGVYFLTIKFNDKYITKKIIKLEN